MWNLKYNFAFKFTCFQIYKKKLLIILLFEIINLKENKHTFRFKNVYLLYVDINIIPIVVTNSITENNN